ncbi:MAG TPA: TfoX/Sxy family protein [Rhizomicrobium sp.]|jgi:DNA transformation protein|nr:TfoX/Sxy family protein [Rhizomicrobium sp.]
MTSEYRRFVAELLAGFGPVEIRRVFNFQGLYHDGILFGLVADERVFLKTDTASRIAFEREGSSPLHYRARDGADVAMSYYELPARLYDEPEEAADWARTAFEAALKSPNTARKAPRDVKSKTPRRRKK